MSVGLARAAARLSAVARHSRSTPNWRPGAVYYTRLVASRGLSTVPDKPEQNAATTSPPSSEPEIPVINVASEKSIEFKTPPASMSRDAESPAVLADAGASTDTPMEVLTGSASGHAVSTAEDAAATAVSMDPVAVAQATESGFSLGDTLLQPAIFLLNTVHDYSGLPWWMAIGMATVVVRTAILPLSVITMRNSARMAALQDEIATRREEVMEAMRSGDRSKAGEKQGALKKFMTDAGVGPSKVLMGPLVQFPIFVSFFVAVRRMSMSDPTMAAGGAAWFADLSVRDPTFVLPIISAFSLLAMTELGGDTGTTKLTPTMRSVMRGMAVFSVPLTYWFPAGVFCYWVPNNIYSVAFSLFVRSKSIKNALGMNVDVSTIPGTKAFELAAKKAAFSAPVSNENLNAATAAASYIKKVDPLNIGTVGTVKPVVHEVQGKPVLLKHRPPKKKKRVKGHA